MHHAMFHLRSSLSRLAVHGLNLLRWFGAEFLRIPMRLGLVPALTATCRLTGIGVVASLLYFQLHEPYLGPLPNRLAEWFLAALISVLVGNVAKELAFALSERIAAWFGRDFDRRGFTLDGRRFRETVYTDGSWTRCESGPLGTVCEWTDTFGGCSKIVTGPPDAQEQLRKRKGTPVG